MAGQVSKLKYVDRKLGAPTDGQQTTRVLYHTIVNPGTTNQLDFFQNFQGLTLGQTNLNQNKLDSAESMVIKSLWFCAWNSSGAVTSFGNGGNDGGFVVDITVGNQKVVKGLPLCFNGGNVAEPFDRIHGLNNGSPLNASLLSSQRLDAVPTELRLLTNIVIPPQVEFTVTVRGTSVNFGDGAVACALSGYGQIFSAGGSF